MKPAEIVPLFVISPLNVATLKTSIPEKPAEIVPLLVILPVKVLTMSAT